MTNSAIERLLRRRIGLMLRVIEIRLRNPTIDQNRLRDRGRSVRRAFHIMTKRAPDKISARSRAHALLWLVRIFGEENGALELFAGMKLIAERFDLLRNEAGNFAFGNSSLQTRVIGVLRGQSAQKCADKIDIAVGNPHLGISRVELERMASLTIVRVADSLHETAIRLRLMTVIAIKFLSVDRWNIGREVPLMIETQNVRIARVFALQLKLGMRFPEVCKRRRVTLGRSR